METFLLVVVLIVLLVRWVYLRDRLNEIDERIAELNRLILHPPPAPVTDLLTPKPAPTPPPRRLEPLATHVAAPAPPPPKPSPIPEPAVMNETPPPPPPPPPFVAEPQPTAARVDWEATVGGNWLNKAGVVLLVIGLALAMAYSFAHIGPLGRVAVSLAVSLAMLICGVVFEPRERYRVFARGLIGGGWAGLYTTVYAMHAVKEALVIPNAFVGAILLICVATGMIVHSLRYRSQTVTGLAYFIAFGTLTLSEVNVLAVVALIPLAASLLYVVHRFEWSRTALLGLIATYGVVVIRGDHGSPLWQAQLLFAIFWLLFETFDILHPTTGLLPLNAVGFLGLSLLKWNTAAPHDVWMLLTACAAAYLVSAVSRWRTGWWQAAATLAAGLAGGAVFAKLDHQWVASALLIEAELVYLAGVRLRAPYLRWIGTGLFTVQMGRLLMGDMASLPTHTWTAIATLDALVFYANRTLAAADLFYGYAAAGLLALVIGYEAPERSRSLAWLGLATASIGFGWWRRLDDFRIHGYLLGILGLTAAGVELQTNQPALWGALAFSYGLTLCSRYFPEGERDMVRLAAGICATCSAAALLWRLAPPEYLGIAWMALALAVLELGLRNLPPEFRIHSYAVGALGTLSVWSGDLAKLSKTRPLIPAAATLLAYAYAARLRASRTVFAVAVGAGTCFLLDAIWTAAPESFCSPLWALVSLALTVAGTQWRDPILEIYGYALAMLAFLRCWGFNLEQHQQAVVAASLCATCFFALQLISQRDRFPRTYFALIGTLMVTLLLWYEASGSLLTVAWGVEGVALLIAGFPLRDRVLRLSGLALLTVCILKLFLWDLRHLETLPRIFSFIVLGLILVGVSWIYTRFREHVARYL